MIGFFIISALSVAFADPRVPFDIQELAKRADACSSVWGATRAASNTKFMSSDIEEKNEATLSTNRCSTLARNVISTCLKYQQDPNLKKICAHLLVQTAEIQPPPEAPTINPHGPNAPAPLPTVAAPPKPNPPPTMTSMPGSGIAPANASGAALSAPPAPAPANTATAPTAPQTEPNVSPVAPVFEGDTSSPGVSRETASPPAAP